MSVSIEKKRDQGNEDHHIEINAACPDTKHLELRLSNECIKVSSQ